ncbi:MAG: patatin-like phospholipase family protein [Alphaproteobacteria bacterium]
MAKSAAKKRKQAPPAPRVGLALGGGAARGWAHLGVMEALGEMGIRPDVVCGTSIGALVGGVHLSGYSAELEFWARRLTKLRMVRYLDVKLGGRGIIGGSRLFAEMERHIGDQTIEDLPVTFATVATDLNTGHEIWLRQGKLTTAIRASFAIPGFFEPINIDGRWLIDGALVNPVPVSVCRALGAQVIIAVRLDSGVSIDPNISEVNGRQASAPAAPSVLGVMMSTVNIVQDRVTRSRLVADPPDVTINAKVGHIGLLEFNRAPELIQLGRAAARRARQDILDLMERHHIPLVTSSPTVAAPHPPAAG